MSVDFDALPGHSRIWIFQADRFLSTAERVELGRETEAFLGGWQAHGKALEAAYRIAERLFLVIADNEAIQKATGCSLDALFHKVGEWEQKWGLALTNRRLTAYRSGGKIEIASWPAFEEAVQSGSITEETRVFDMTVPNKKAFQDHFETRAAQSWHKKYLV